MSHFFPFVQSRKNHIKWIRRLFDFSRPKMRTNFRFRIFKVNRAHFYSLPNIPLNQWIKVAILAYEQNHLNWIHSKRLINNNNYYYHRFGSTYYYEWTIDENKIKNHIKTIPTTTKRRQKNRPHSQPLPLAINNKRNDKKKKINHKILSISPGSIEWIEWIMDR